MSIFEVTSVEPGLVGVRDLLSGETRSVREEKGSHVLVPGDNVLARIIDFRGMSLFGGMYGRALPPLAAAVVVDAVRRKLRLLKRNVPLERLRTDSIGDVFIAYWIDVLFEHDERLVSPPTLQNSDGDPILFVSDSYAFDAASRPRIEQQLAAIEGAIAAGPEFVVLRDKTLIARIIVSDDTLLVETISENRADAARRLIEEGCAGMVRFTTRDVTPLSFDKGAAQKRPEPDEAQAAVIREVKEEHYRKWVDLPIPALGGLTQREAARRAKSRRELEVLLREVEHRESRLPAAERFDFGSIRRELRLKK